MKIAMLYFSLTGQETAGRLAESLRAEGHEVSLDGKSKYLPDSISESHLEWTREHFVREDALIYVGACGIAVRSIAPFVVSKKTDPAVLVIDECGRFVISLLSGHLGGANELTGKAAGILGAIPVITTATDLHGRFAVDEFARKNGCAIFPMEAAKAVSAALLAGEPVGFYSDYPIEGEVPKGLTVREERRDTEEKAEALPRVGIAVSIRSDCRPFPMTVQVVPRTVTLGIGCRKEKDVQALREAAERCLRESGIQKEALQGMASIDLKKEESGLLKLSEDWQLPFETFSERELEKAEGSFTPSDFVKRVTGIDNVCERSAVLASGQGKLLWPKKGNDGVTTALAERDWRVHFE